MEGGHRSFFLYAWSFLYSFHATDRAGYATGSACINSKDNDEGRVEDQIMDLHRMNSKQCFMKGDY